MRLADAIAETEGCTGLQVHRSHWVALDHIAAARREGARGVLTLVDGREIPVSRTYVPSLRDAGLL
jgi:DNA-binding LytR/AlgR family response regulator